MLKSRKYKSGSRWALWRWTEVPSEFITRLHLVMTPLFSICLHWLRKPDPEPHLHDHPVSFLSLILRGGYLEKRDVGEGVRYRLNLWWNWFRASPEDRHTISAVLPGTVTLAFMGPKRRSWGYHTPDGWVHWKDYNAAKYKSKPN